MIDDTGPEIQPPQVTRHTRPVFFDPSSLPWTEWVMPGTWFKLLNLNDIQGSFTILLKVDPDMDTPIHKHAGGVEVFVLEGEFGYDDDRGGAGCYAFEASGSVHQPDSPGGTLMFAVIYGPIIGYNDDGSVAGVVDNDLMYELAKANSAADHIQRTPL